MLYYKNYINLKNKQITEDFFMSSFDYITDDLNSRFLICNNANTLTKLELNIVYNLIYKELNKERENNG